MKVHIHISFYFILTISAGLSQTADMLARQIITPKSVEGFYVSAIGVSKDKQDICRAIVDSPRIFRDYILSNQVSEKIRISYALALLATARASNQDTLKKQQQILGSRLAELQKKAEQDAAANP